MRAWIADHIIHVIGVLLVSGAMGWCVIAAIERVDRDNAIAARVSRYDEFCDGQRDLIARGIRRASTAHTIHDDYAHTDWVAARACMPTRASFEIGCAEHDDGCERTELLGAFAWMSLR